MGYSTVSELSKKNKYHLPKHRFLELKHFCLQYPDWKREVADIQSALSRQPIYNQEINSQIEFKDPTANLAIRLSKLNSKISLVGKIAEMSDSDISYYILKGVTEDISFVKLKTVYEIPCERDMYYDRYRKFFWLLSCLKE